MRRYRCQILIPSDRRVTLHLPPNTPQGWAEVTVECIEAPEDAPENPQQEIPTADDIEWWDEFTDEEEPLTDEPSGLVGRIEALEE